MSERPVEVLFDHLPGVIVNAENDWALKVAKSILCKSKRRRWKPSPKQLGIILRLVAELLNESDLVVIEESEIE